MAVRYQMEYHNAEGELFILTISNKDYEGDPVDINGYCVIDMPNVDNLLEPIRGTGLQIVIEANEDLNISEFVDLELLEEKVKLTNNGRTIFFGFLDPEGVFEDYVSPQWEMTLNAVDALGLMEDLSFVDYVTGLPFNGKITDKEIIRHCLNRTGSTRNVITSVNTRYFGLPNDQDPIENVVSNTERFYKNDGETVMSCREVLESILLKYAAVMVQQDGKWHIFSPAELVNRQARWHFEYLNLTYALLSIIPTLKTPSRVLVGSKRDNFPIFWVNANQQKRIEPGKASFRLNYKYGFVKSLFSNPNFNNNAENWDVITSVSYLNGGGIEIPAQGPEVIAIQTNETLTVDQNDVIRFEIDFEHNAFSQGGLFFTVTITSGGTVYYLKKDGSWTTSFTRVSYVGVGNVRFNNTITSEPIPETGDIQLNLYQNGVNANIIYFAQITPVVNANAQGETHTSYIENATNKRVLEGREINVGDNVSDLYLGALYERDENTNTFNWSNFLIPSISGTLLTMLSQIILSFWSKNRIIFEGDMYGHIKPTQIYNIENSLIGGVQYLNYLPSRISYNTKTNVSQCVFKELGVPAGVNINTEVSIDYGNVQKPTIKG